MYLNNKIKNNAKRFPDEQTINIICMPYKQRGVNGRENGTLAKTDCDVVHWLFDSRLTGRKEGRKCFI